MSRGFFDKKVFCVVRIPLVILYGVFISINETSKQIRVAISRACIERMICKGGVALYWNPFWSILSTCEQQGRNVMSLLNSRVESLVHGLAPPSLCSQWHCFSSYFSILIQELTIHGHERLPFSNGLSVVPFVFFRSETNLLHGDIKKSTGVVGDKEFVFQK